MLLPADGRFPGDGTGTQPYRECIYIPGVFFNGARAAFLGFQIWGKRFDLSRCQSVIYHGVHDSSIVWKLTPIILNMPAKQIGLLTQKQRRTEAQQAFDTARFYKAIPHRKDAE